MTYSGEHTWAGTLGHVLAVSSFSFALLSTIAYGLAARAGHAGWAKLGRLGFRVHSIAVAGIVLTLFTMLLRHWFEFDYVWKHSNREMPLRYILSCFWEGQEGSFLLWTFWHMVLGNLLIARLRRTARLAEWEPPVLAVIALVQVFLATMLLGIHVFDVRIGSSPFLLIRQLPENLGLPWTTMENYLQAIPQFADGRGLNPLLQNYWMVIHPPTLFLGFAATLVPFAFAIAALWKRRYTEWIDPALPWTFFGVMVLGTGILMGGAWAYEALSFGGFWAWDPVENASLVPWLTLVGSGHVMLINRRKEAPSLFTGFVLVLLTFVLVLYSTFLTRSGVLGDTSVHSFTGEGMLPGLLVFLLFFVALSVGMLNARKDQRRFYALLCGIMLLLGVFLQVQVAAILVFAGVSVVMTVVAYRTGPFRAPTEEEQLWSREFWLFIGALVLLLSAAQVTFTTSVPVFNLLLEPFTTQMASLAQQSGSDLLNTLAGAKLAPPAKPIPHYNKWQIPFAFIVSLLVAFGQYLRWKDTDMKRFRRELLLGLAVAVVLTVVAVIVLEYRLEEANLIALLFATAFAAAANAAYVRKGIKGKLAHAGPSVAHVGFALVLLGALVSTSRQDEISRNMQGPDLRFLNEGFDNNTDLLLYKGDTVRMGEHFLTYRGKEKDGVNLYFDMDYFTPVPSTYAAGDTVRVRNSLFVANDAHTASVRFLDDQAHWRELDTFTKRALWHARAWSATRPGEKAFALRPLVQLNPRFGNVAEPSTRHRPLRDLYTHVRFADLDDTDSTAYMPSRRYDKQVGDTIITPTSVILLDSLRAVRDSVTIQRLGPDYTVYQLRMRVRDLYVPDRWFEANAISIHRNGTPVAGKAMELPELKQKYELASVEGRSVGLNVYDREFVVLQAIVFPGINILWTGCILMALGTFMAVRQRVSATRRKA